MKTLITAGTTAAAFAVKRSMGISSPVIFGDNEDFPVPVILADQFVTIPKSSSDTFIHELLTRCISLQITTLIPVRPDEILLLSVAKSLFLEFDIEILDLPAAASAV